MTTTFWVFNTNTVLLTVIVVEQIGLLWLWWKHVNL